MRVKKIIAPVKDKVLNFEVELNPIVDDKDFLKTQKIAYTILFPQLDGEFLLDFYPSDSDYIPSNPTDKKDYTLTIEVPKAFFLGPFIEAIRIYREVISDWKYEYTRIIVCGTYGNNLQPLTTFSIPTYSPHKRSGRLFFQLQLIAESFSPADEKLKNLEIIRKKKLEGNHLGRMLMSEVNYRDFTIIAGNFEIRVHKCVLASQSPVLAVEMAFVRENSTLKINDDTISEKSVQFAIDYMYSGQIEVERDDNFGQVLLGIYEFAHKYQVVNLKWSVLEKCQTHIEYFEKNQEEKLQFIRIASCHETQMDDLKPFLAIFGPYSIE